MSKKRKQIVVNFNKQNIVISNPESIHLTQTIIPPQLNMPLQQLFPPDYTEYIYIIELLDNLHIHLYITSMCTTHKQIKAEVQTDWQFQQCLTGEDMHIIKG